MYSCSYIQSLPYQIDRSMFLCTAKRLGPSHEGAILSVPEGQKLVHGQNLVCDHDGCKASRSFLYCALGNHAVLNKNFGAVDGRHKCLEGKIGFLS